jgi:hypothetical protein
MINTNTSAVMLRQLGVPLGATDAFPSRHSSGVQVVKIQQFVKAHNQPECCFYCTDVEFLR